MIHFSMVVRTHDGLPLAGCTDVSAVEDNQDLREALKELKLLSKRVDKYDDRCSYSFSTFTIHFISALDLTFLVLCDVVYPVVLAFSFLSELQRQFLRSYDHSARSKAARPYAFVEFDGFIQKTRVRYNQPRSLVTRLDVSSLSQEMQLRPPTQVCYEDLHTTQIPLGAPSTSFRTGASSRRHYMPMGLAGWVCSALSAFCAFLNLMRGVTVYNAAHIELDHEVMEAGSAFFLCCLLFFFQVYLMCVPTGMRRPLACATLGSICVCQLYLWEYRTQPLIFFHVAVGCAATFVIFTRKIQEKLPQYTL